MTDKSLDTKGITAFIVEKGMPGFSIGKKELKMGIHVEGHIREERVQAAFIGLHRTCPQVRFLGSYPRLDACLTMVLVGTGDKGFVVARAWVADVLEGRTL